MEEKNKILLKSSALVIADSLVTKIPGLDIAWGLSKALYGSGMQLRQNRALEWVEMVRDNPKIFTEKILNSENFQDGFAYTFEKYIKERNENKRKIIKNIFLGFGRSTNMDGFELEQYTNILSLLDANEVSFLRNFYSTNYTEDQVKGCNHLIQLGLIEIGEGGKMKMGLRNLIEGTNSFSSYYSRSSNNSADIPLDLTYLGKQLVQYLMT